MQMKSPTAPALLLAAAALATTGCMMPGPTRLPSTPKAFEFGRNAEVQIPAMGLRAVTLRCGAGSLRVIGIEGLERVEANARVHVRAKKEQDAERLAQQIDLRVDGRDTTGPSIVVVEPRSALVEEYRVDLVVKVPTSLRVAIFDGAGGVEVSGIRGGMHLDSTRGDVQIYDVSGGITVQNAGRRCIIEDVRGLVKVSDGPGELRVTQVTGEVYVHDTSGKLFIGYISGDVTAENNPNGIEMVSVEGQVELRGIPADSSDLKGVAEIRFAKAREEDINPPK